MKKILAMVLTAFGLNMTSCSQNENITTVNAEEFEKAIIEKAPQLVDVRTADEYAEGHIAYAQNLDVNSADFSAKALAALDKLKPVYVYCRSGHRSMNAAKTLAKEGFRVVNLQGGIMEWQSKGKVINR
jgi:rhodanese-related sulfurtransferase